MTEKSGKILDFVRKGKKKDLFQVGVDAELLEVFRTEVKAMDLTLVDVQEAMILSFLHEIGKPFKRGKQS